MDKVYNDDKIQCNFVTDDDLIQWSGLIAQFETLFQISLNGRTTYARLATSSAGFRVENLDDVDQPFVQGSGPKPAKV